MNANCTDLAQCGNADFLSEQKMSGKSLTRPGTGAYLKHNSAYISDTHMQSKISAFIQETVNINPVSEHT